MEDQLHTATDAVQVLKNVFGEAQNGRICRLLAMDKEHDFSNDDILTIANDDQTALSKAMGTISASLISSITQLSSVLPDISFISPRAAPAAEGPWERRGVQSDSAGRTQTPQEGTRSSEITVKTPVVRISNTLEPDLFPVLTTT